MSIFVNTFSYKLENYSVKNTLFKKILNMYNSHVFQIMTSNAIHVINNVDIYTKLGRNK